MSLYDLTPAIKERYRHFLEANFKHILEYTPSAIAAVQKGAKGLSNVLEFDKSSIQVNKLSGEGQRFIRFDCKTHKLDTQIPLVFLAGARVGLIPKNLPQQKQRDHDAPKSASSMLIKRGFIHMTFLVETPIPE